MRNYKDYFYLVFRVLVGLGFMLHGGQKLFGIFGSRGAVDVFSLMGLAGIIEFFGGLLIIFGLFTAIVAAVSAVEMIVALIMAHFPGGINPLTNGGEPAMLYFAAFLAVMAYGPGRISLDRVLFSKKKGK